MNQIYFSAYQVEKARRAALAAQEAEIAAYERRGACYLAWIIYLSVIMAITFFGFLIGE